MKILAFVILHTGKPYLRAAIESIIDQVDHVVVLYSAKPSQGFQADIPCPDKAQELFVAIADGCGSMAKFYAKVEIHVGEWANEADHINAIWPHAEGYDWVWRFDADEVSPLGMVAEMIRQANQDFREAAFEFYRVPFQHFWRSFSKVCRDGSHPIRLFRIHKPSIRNGLREGDRTLDSKDGKWVVHHFGYAQPTRYIEYKMQVSGHRPEWRPNWFQERWLANAQFDTHPVMYPTHWNPVDFDKTKLPEVLRRHPFYDAEIIE